MFINPELISFDIYKKKYIIFARNINIIKHIYNLFFGIFRVFWEYYVFCYYNKIKRIINNASKSFNKYLKNISKKKSFYKLIYIYIYI